jgi:16S rRNA (guanine527-N7)-methyltransferase
MPTPQESAQLIVNKAITELSFPPSAALTGFLAQVLEWNSTLGLVSRKDPPAACERLFCESLELGRHVDVGGVRRLADVGSGAGFPGLVWAVLFPRVNVVLIERRQKRALFLERTSRMVGAGNVIVLPDDLGHVSRETPPDRAFDLVTTVAVGDPARLAEDVERMLLPGGRFASTVSRDTALRTRLGAHLVLLDRTQGKFGCYAIYRRGV